MSCRVIPGPCQRLHPLHRHRAHGKVLSPRVLEEVMSQVQREKPELLTKTFLEYMKFSP